MTLKRISLILTLSSYVLTGCQSNSDPLAIIAGQEELNPVTTGVEQAIDYTYSIIDAHTILKTNGDEEEVFYSSEKTISQVEVYDDCLYVIEGGDLLKLDGVSDPIKILDYSDLRSRNHPAPTEINEILIQDEWIYYMFTLDIYPYILRVDLNGQNQTELYSWYDEHYVTDLIRIEGAYIIFDFTDIWVLDAPVLRARVKKDGSGYRPKNAFMDFLD